MCDQNETIRTNLSNLARMDRIGVLFVSGLLGAALYLGQRLGLDRAWFTLAASRGSNKRTTERLRYDLWKGTLIWASNPYTNLKKAFCEHRQLNSQSDNQSILTVSLETSITSYLGRLQSYTHLMS